MPVELLVRHGSPATVGESHHLGGPRHGSISATRHAAAQIGGEGGYRPPCSARINPTWTAPGAGELGGIVHDQPNYAAIGAVGPDLVVFLPDLRDVELPGVGGIRARCTAVLRGSDRMAGIAERMRVLVTAPEPRRAGPAQ